MDSQRAAREGQVRSRVRSGKDVSFDVWTVRRRDTIWIGRVSIENIIPWTLHDICLSLVAEAVEVLLVACCTLRK